MCGKKNNEIFIYFILQFYYKFPGKYCTLHEIYNVNIKVISIDYAKKQDLFSKKLRQRYENK